MKICLDLLPQQRKQELKRKKIYRKILYEEILFSLPIIAFIVILVNVYYLLALQRNAHVAAYSIEQAQEKYQQLGKYEEKFKKINAVDQELVKIQSGHLHWMNFLREFDKIFIDGVYVTNLSTKDYEVFIVGKARTRDILLEFKNKLESSSCFEKIDIPLSNLVVKDDVDFQIDLTLKEDCLKEQQ